MDLIFEEHRARKIVNVHKHTDSWFWDKYTASPYAGCRSGCEFCYLRGGKYSGGLNSDTFNTNIRVKVNAVELLQKDLAKLPPDVINCGDWQQPAETKYQLSRQMLQVVLDFGFPLFIVERSPLLIRDLDLLAEINRKTWVGVAFSISNLDPALKQAFEPHSPGLNRRLQAMEKLAQVGIQVGTAMMPILPGLGDDKPYLEEIIQATRDHGGTFVLAGGMTMFGAQAQRMLRASRQFDVLSETRLRQIYQWEEGQRPSNSPDMDYMRPVLISVRELCEQYGLPDRLPRYIAPGPLAVNKRISERLAKKTYDLELEGAKQYRIWAYQKAYWTIDELSESIADLYHEKGEEGLNMLPGIGQHLSKLLVSWLEEDTCKP
jgi:DNA repair photolyase